MSTLIQDPHNSTNWFAGNNLQSWEQNSFFGTGDQTNTATGQLKTLLDNALGSVERSALASRLNNNVSGYNQVPNFIGLDHGAYLAFRPNITAETFTGQIPAPVPGSAGSAPFITNARFIVRLFSKTSFSGSPPGDHHRINSNGSAVSYMGRGATAPFQDRDQTQWWATANHKSLAIFGLTNQSRWLFRWAGVLNTSLALTYPTNCAIISLQNDENGVIDGAFRPLQVASDVVRLMLVSGEANYSIACADSTNAGTCNIQLTTLWLRDNTSGSPPIGTCDNLLLGKGQSWQLGQAIYVKRRIPGCVTTTDPVEGSLTRSYIACARFGTDTLFMRTADAFAPPFV